jgi:hypothetical protein
MTRPPRPPNQSTARTPEQSERRRASREAWRDRNPREWVTRRARKRLASLEQLVQLSGSDLPDSPAGAVPDAAALARLEQLEHEIAELRVMLVRQSGSGPADEQRSGSPAARPASGASPTRAMVNSLPGRVVHPGGGGGERRTPAPPEAQPEGVDEARLEQLWTHPRVLAAIDERGLNAAFERANFESKPQGKDRRNWTPAYLEAWLRRSVVKVPDPAPLVRGGDDRRPARVAPVGPAPSAYDHDPWVGREAPISPADQERAAAGLAL